jgi:hypothetical protein
LNELNANCRKRTAATAVAVLRIWRHPNALIAAHLFRSALRAGLGIAPGPLTAAVFAVNSGRIAARLGRTAPAAVGCLFIAASAGGSSAAPSGSPWWSRCWPARCRTDSTCSGAAGPLRSPRP